MKLQQNGIFPFAAPSNVILPEYHIDGSMAYSYRLEEFVAGVTTPPSQFLGLAHANFAAVPRLGISPYSRPCTDHIKCYVDISHVHCIILFGPTGEIMGVGINVEISM